jgi:16S rRNA (guanine1516-N2)-methyltransferase
MNDAGERFDLLLVAGGDRLELHDARRGAPGPISVDFLAGPVGYRSRSGRSRHQPIALAVGLRSGTRTVIDATAGLGGDAFLLAGLGCRVTAVERSAVLAALIRDGLARARVGGDEHLAEIIERIQLVAGDARDVLEDLPEASRPDVVYLDPMYVPRRKSALAKKEMRICRLLVGADADAAELFEVARHVARKRVVVKRHRRAPALSPNPTTKHVGTTVRYDVYVVA